MNISVSSKIILSLNNKIGYIADVGVSGIYSHGGESFDCGKYFGIHTPEFVSMIGNGYRFQYDKDTKKVKLFSAAPPIVYDELHAIDPTTGLITLNYPAAFIMNVALTGGQNLKMRSTGLAISGMSTSECCLVSQIAAGERTQLRCGVGTSPDLLSGQGAFTGAATGWTVPAAPWTYNTNAVDKDGDGADALSHDAFVPVIGKTYKVCFSISNWTVGTVTAGLGGASGAAAGADGDYVQYITATSTAGLTFTPTNTARFTIDSVTVTLMEAKVTYVTQAWKEVFDNLVQDEVITLATGANTLANKILALMYVDQMSTTAAALTPVDEDDTAASGEVEVAFNVATGQLTVNAAQNEKAAKVTYIKVPDSGFLKDRLVHNETATKTGSDPYVNTFDYPILLWGYTGCMPVNAGVTQRLIDLTATPEAGEVIIDWFNRGIRGGGAPAAGTPIAGKSDVTGTGAYVWGVIDEIPNLQDLEVADGVDIDIASLAILVIGN